MKKNKYEIIILILLIITIIEFIYFYFKLFPNSKNMNKTNSFSSFYTGTVSIEKYNNKNYYIFKGDYSGEYDIQKASRYLDKDNDFEVKKVMNYNEYKDYCSKWEIDKKYSDVFKNYIVFSYISWGAVTLDVRLANVKYDGNDADIYLWDDESGEYAGCKTYTLIIPTRKNVDSINIISTYTEDEFENIKNPPKNTRSGGMDWSIVDKPIIYLYPTEKTNVKVKLLKENNITCSYPKYKDEWNVLANPNGDLIDLDTSRSLYSLYYESENDIEFKVEKEGFVIKGEDSAKFLEEKLSILGLTDREAEEFIVYWLPKLEANNYNYIRFATMDEINENMPIEITPNPDTIIRVLMTYKGLDNRVEVEEQKLETPNRVGFVVVEWGGSEIK